jgi:hypothetical protein
MPDSTVIKAGTLDDGGAHLNSKPAVEFYAKDRVSYLKPLEGVGQKERL